MFIRLNCLRFLFRLFSLVGVLLFWTWVIGSVVGIYFLFVLRELVLWFLWFGCFVIVGVSLLLLITIVGFIVWFVVLILILCWFLHFLSSPVWILCILVPLVWAIGWCLGWLCLDYSMSWVCLLGIVVLSVVYEMYLLLFFSTVCLLFSLVVFLYFGKLCFYLLSLGLWLLQCGSRFRLWIGSVLSVRQVLCWFLHFLVFLWCFVRFWRISFCYLCLRFLVFQVLFGVLETLLCLFVLLFRHYFHFWWLFIW